MNKFKIGDKVRIKLNELLGDSRLKYKNKITKVINIRDAKAHPIYKYVLNISHTYLFSDADLEFYDNIFKTIIERFKL